MSVWDKLKSLFGGGPARPVEPGAPVAEPPGQPPPRPAAKPARPARRTLADFENPRVLAPPPGAEGKPPSDPRAMLPPSAGTQAAADAERAMLLRGMLTAPQLAEIREVHERWRKQLDAQTLSRWLAAKTADAAIAAQRRERAERKAELRRLAAERRAQRAAEVARRRLEDIVFLGAGVSGGLADRRSDVEALQARGLPALSTPADVARALGVEIPRLRWLCFHTEAAEKTHYVYFEIPKRSGGTRLLSAPHRDLGKAQRWVLDNVLAKLPTELPAHGFVTGRSTVTNATPHLGSDLVVNLDLKDFFPSITFQRVRGVFRGLGYSPAVATVFALLCTEPPRRKVEYDGQPLWVAVGPRALPQGACTSPALSNQVARKLDRRLAGMARKSGWTYTRYADDLTFSAPRSNEAGVAMLLARVRHVVGEEGFSVQEKKGRVQRKSGRQTVTGIVVNQKPGLPREEVRMLRAILNNARRTGLAAQNREGRPNFEAWLRGKIAYLCMVDRQKGVALLRQLDALGAQARVG